MEEQGIIVAGLLAELHGVGAERPVEAPAALRRQIVAEIFVLDDRLVDDEVQPLDVGELLLGNSGKRVAMLDDRYVPAARRLLRAQRGDDVGARLLGPFGARLDHAAGRQRADGHVGTKHEQLVVALRQRELDVGILPRLDACARARRSPPTRTPHLASALRAPPDAYTAASCPNGSERKARVFRRLAAADRNAGVPFEAMAVDRARRRAEARSAPRASA